MAKERDGETNEEGSCKTDCYLVVPPLLKYSAGPLLGPAVLEGAARDSGFQVRTIDLNIEYIRSEGWPSGPDHGGKFYGDHAKPSGGLESCANRFWTMLADAFDSDSNIGAHRVKRAWYSHSQLYGAVENLSESSFGDSLEVGLVSLSRPRVLGVSVMWSGQIIPAMVLSRISKHRWPKTPVVWGGSHVAAIIDEITQDAEFGRFVDGYLPGHCEGSFLHLLSSARIGRFECPGLLIPGRGNPASSTVNIEPPPLPAFSNLSRYGCPRLTLPIELSVGCAYALCSFCTYPAVEGKYRRFTLDSLEMIVKLAEKDHAAVSIKDSLVTPDRLKAISQLIKGRAEWSACTKLSESLHEQFLRDLAKNGCRTLEVGLESLSQDTQRRINKVQSVELLDRFLRAAASSEISVVINYITGFPWENPEETETLLCDLKSLVESHSNLVARIEWNAFNLERLSPMALDPERYQIRITQRWPWSSILDWQPLVRTSPSKSALKGARRMISNMEPTDGIVILPETRVSKVQFARSKEV